MKPANPYFTDMPVTVFTVMSMLAAEHGAVNLGQGFPDTDGPQWLRDIAAKAITDGPNQYPPMFGLPELREAAAAHDNRFYGLNIDPSEVLVTSGATEALADSFFGLLNEGDEAIVIEPYFDSYVPQIRMAGGIPKFVRLEAPNWHIDEETLRRAFSDKTKLLVLNSPLNPAGKTFNKDELELIARLLIEFDAYAVCDEVYEHMAFNDQPHIPLMTLPGMRERCVRIASAGKTFSMTGWKVGYLVATQDLLKPIASAHQFVTFATNPATQKAVAAGLQADDSYFNGLNAQMDEGRKILTEGLTKIGFDVLPCTGTYFLAADYTTIASKAGFDSSGDYDFCRWMTEKAGVTAIPMSPFYGDPNNPPPQNLIRFCFAKKRDVLEYALNRLSRAF